MTKVHDEICGIEPVSLHNTKASSKDDRDKSIWSCSRKAPQTPVPSVSSTLIPQITLANRHDLFCSSERSKHTIELAVDDAANSSIPRCDNDGIDGSHFGRVCCTCYAFGLTVLLKMWLKSCYTCQKVNKFTKQRPELLLSQLSRYVRGFTKAAKPYQTLYSWICSDYRLCMSAS